MTTAPASEPQLLILDLDETLIHAAADPQPQLPPPDFHIDAYPVWKRPGVDAFLAAVCAWFQVAVWTSARADYAQTVVTHLVPHPDQLLFVWSRSRCTQRWHSDSGTFVWHKNLTKVTRTFRVPLERILMLDDSPEKLARHYGNHVPIRPFVGDPLDTELPTLLPFLDRLRSAPNVRLVEKRGWRTNAVPLATESSPNSALKPTSRIGAIFSVWMRSNAISVFNHLRLAGLALVVGRSVDAARTKLVRRSACASPANPAHGRSCVLQ